MAVLGVGALAALRGYLWLQDGETWKAVALGAAIALALAVGGWAWHWWKKARKRIYDPLLIREKVSRIAFDAELQVVAVLPAMELRAARKRARELLEPVAAAYRHYDQPSRGAVQCEPGAVRPTQPVDDAPVRPRTVWNPKRPGRPRGGSPVAPAGSQG